MTEVFLILAILPLKSKAFNYTLFPNILPEQTILNDSIAHYCLHDCTNCTPASFFCYETKTIHKDSLSGHEYLIDVQANNFRTKGKYPIQPNER